MLVPDTTRAEALSRVDRAEPDGRQDADVRARLQHPVRHDHAAQGRGRLDDRAQVARASRPRAVRRRRRDAGAGRGATRTPAARRCAQALSYGKGIGTTRAGVLVTTFAEETETDLFGEQAVLCGGVSELVKAGFKTLVDAGYQPEVAYFECLHELKLIVDLMYRGGLNYMRYSVSDTAEYGDYTAGPRVIGTESRAEMLKMLAEIQDGTFAKKWVKENEDGRPWFGPHRASEQTQILEEVGSKLRALMPFIQPVTVRPDGQGA